MSRVGRRHQRGFTLVELMVTLGILAALAMFSMPMLSVYLPGFRAKSAARDLVSQLQMARLRAIAKNKRHLLSVDTAAQTITLSEINTSGPQVITVLTFGTTPPAVPKGPHFRSVLIGREGSTGYPLESPSESSTDPVAFSTPGGGTVATSLEFLPNGASTRGGEIYLIPSNPDVDVRTDNSYAVQVLRPGLVRVFRYQLNEATGEYEWREP